MTTTADPPAAFPATEAPLGGEPVSAVRRRTWRGRARRDRDPGEPARPTAPPGPLSPVRFAVAGVAAVIAALLLGCSANLVVMSGIEEHAAQQSGYDKLRDEIALGTAPVSQTGSNSGKLLPLGAPVAVLHIPELGLDHEVVFNGTTAGVMASGPGHMRTTVLPGQAGASVIMGRQAAYGGPFSHLDQLKAGDTFTVTTGQGVATYKVTGSRLPGAPLPPLLAPGGSQLTLESVTGTPYMTGTVLRVDALMTGRSFPTPALLNITSLPGDEQAMGSDASSLLPLLVWLEVLLVVSLLAIICWKHWSARHAWIIFGPAVALAGLYAAREVSLLLPNLT